MIKKFYSLLITLLIFGTILFPILIIDILIIYFTKNYYSKLIYLVLFLLIFYILDLLLGIFIDNILKISNDFNLFKVNHLFSGIFDFLGSSIIIIYLDSFFNSINLSISIKLLIAGLHTLLFYLINRFHDENDQNDIHIESSEIIKSIEKEVNCILKKEDEDMLTCIKLMREKYPDVPLKNIIKIVRKTNNINH